jgi:hypothetical protein
MVGPREQFAVPEFSILALLGIRRTVAELTLYTEIISRTRSSSILQARPVATISPRSITT